MNSNDKNTKKLTNEELNSISGGAGTNSYYFYITYKYNPSDASTMRDDFGPYASYDLANSEMEMKLQEYIMMGYSNIFGSSYSR